MRFEVRFRRLHQQLAIVFANVPSAEIKPIFYMRYLTLLFFFRINTTPKWQRRITPPL